MVQLLSNLTSAATAASLLRILDFTRQYGLDVSGALCTDLTPVQSYQTAAVSNQEWILSGGPLTFQISVSNCNKFLTYSGTATGALAIRSQPSIRSAASSSWMLTLVNPIFPSGPWNIIEAASGMALTAWNSDAATMSKGNPITFEVPNPNDTRQQFWFQAGNYFGVDDQETRKVVPYQYCLCIYFVPYTAMSTPLFSLQYLLKTLYLK
ncbi:hypothetical protein B0H13DRAFT_2558041 [Mycena leptocephala]|nr:hypothetical protein B0H13DRAFT_2558041 [Mycena leptocephala]